ncbi:MAG: hypothetical protein NT016_01940 [Candidatus Aenigmarchaeota archaeon]|nr:hypothetical protein [Candidatus Aenigmarchaeota archaeon]
MHPIVNIVIGAVLLIAAIAYIYTDQYGAWSDFLTVVNGIVPAFVALIGVFIIWLELDELKVQGELKSEKSRKK